MPKTIPSSTPIPKIIVAIQGASASGKTTAAQNLQNYLKGLGITAKILSQDSYYKGKTGKDKRTQSRNFDVPTVIDMENFTAHLEALKCGKDSIDVPNYDFVTSDRKGTTTQNFSECEVIIVEGMFVGEEQMYPRNENKRGGTSPIDLSFFIDTNYHVTVARRVKRDINDPTRADSSPQETINYMNSRIAGPHGSMIKYLKPKPLPQPSKENIKKSQAISNYNITSQNTQNDPSDQHTTIKSYDDSNLKAKAEILSVSSPEVKEQIQQNTPKASNTNKNKSLEKYILKDNSFIRYTKTDYQGNAVNTQVDTNCLFGGLAEINKQIQEVTTDFLKRKNITEQSVEQTTSINDNQMYTKETMGDIPILKQSNTAPTPESSVSPKTPLESNNQSNKNIFTQSPSPTTLTNFSLQEFMIRIKQEKKDASTQKAKQQKQNFYTKLEKQRNEEIYETSAGKSWFIPNQ